MFSAHHTEDDPHAEAEPDIVMWGGRPMVRTITAEKFELPDGTFYEMQNETWHEMQDGGNETWNARN